MAKPLIFLLGDQEYPLSLEKVDRGKLYGTKELIALDDDDAVCELATLADDGHTLIGRGGTGLGWLDADGKWREKSDLIAHNIDGDPVQPVASSFEEPIRLFDTASDEDLLNHDIRLVYRMKFVGSEESDASASNIDELLGELKRETIFQFPYSYRGGLEADAGFLLANTDGEIMMLVGRRAQITMVSMQSSKLLVDEEDFDAEDAGQHEIDFGMI